MRARKHVLLLTTSILLSSCARTFFSYEPEATWGKPGLFGGCPLHSPTINLEQPEFPWLEINIGVWHDISAQNRGLKDPTLFIQFWKRLRFSNLLGSSYEDRKAAAVHVKASSNVVSIAAADGTLRRIEVPELAGELVFVGEKSGGIIQIMLKDLKHQSMVVTVPEFKVNGKTLGGGVIKFKHERVTRSLRC